LDYLARGDGDREGRGTLEALFVLAGLPRRYAPDETTSHLTKAASCQVIGYRNDNDSAEWIATGLTAFAMTAVDLISASLGLLPK